MGKKISTILTYPVLFFLILLGGIAQANSGLDIDEIKKAAEQGDIDAQYQLGVLYGRGEGVPHEATKAYAWFSLAAEQGNAEAANSRDVAAKEFTAEQYRKAQGAVDELKSKISIQLKRPSPLRFGLSTPQEIVSQTAHHDLNSGH